MSTYIVSGMLAGEYLPLDHPLIFDTVAVVHDPEIEALARQRPTEVDPKNWTGV